MGWDEMEELEILANQFLFGFHDTLVFIYPSDCHLITSRLLLLRLRAAAGSDVEINREEDTPEGGC